MIGPAPFAERVKKILSWKNKLKFNLILRQPMKIGCFSVTPNFMTVKNRFFRVFAKEAIPNIDGG